MRKLILLIVPALFLSGCCDSNPEMREDFGERPKVLFDVGAGKAYVVQHQCDQSYTVQPLNP